MRYWLLSAVLLSWLGRPAWAAPAPLPITLIKAGQAQCAIFVPARVLEPDQKVKDGLHTPEELAELGRQRLKASVFDLARCLQQMSGAEVPVLGGPPSRQRRLPILVGELSHAIAGPLKLKGQFQQAWRLVVKPGYVALQGETDLATSYAVYEILDRLGCRWYIPGELGEVIPRRGTVVLPLLDVAAEPFTARRDIWYVDDAFKRRNRMGGIYLSASHALEDYIPRRELEAHPEWNALLHGKRSINGRLCWANPEVVAALTAGVRRHLQRYRTPSVSLSPNDGAEFCECEKCRALDAGDRDPTLNTISITDRYVALCNQIVGKLAPEYPGTLFGFLAYVQYTRPPVRETPHPQLVPEIAPITYCRAHAMTDACPSRSQLKPIVEGWGKKACHLAYYNYMFHLAETSAPYPMIHQMSRELPIIYANKVRFWQPETSSLFENTLPGMVLSSRMAWNPVVRPDDVLREFYAKYYGPAAAAMQRYWEIFDRAWIDVPEHSGSGAGHVRRFTPAVLQAARVAMDEALAASTDLTIYRRVKMHEQALSQFELFMDLRHQLNNGDVRVARSSTRMERDAVRWMGRQLALGEEYQQAFAFGKVNWTPYTISGEMFKDFYWPVYRDRDRLAKEFNVLIPAQRQWKWQVDRKDEGSGQGWQLKDFNDAAWKATDTAVDTWYALGLDDYYGTVWYRARLPLKGYKPGKKLYLWVSSTDGKCQVFVNGRAIPWRDAAGKEHDSFTGFCAPASWDITSALGNEDYVQVSLACTRVTTNEIGTGGLIGPVVLYSEK